MSPLFIWECLTPYIVQKSEDVRIIFQLNDDRSIYHSPLLVTLGCNVKNLPNPTPYEPRNINNQINCEFHLLAWRLDREDHFNRINSVATNQWKNRTNHVFNSVYKANCMHTLIFSNPDEVQVNLYETLVRYILKILSTLSLIIITFTLPCL